jgi:hypothetical protein
VQSGECRVKDRAEFVDLVLETGGRALDELAAELLARLGWID